AYRGGATLPPCEEPPSEEGGWAWPTEGEISGLWHADKGGHTGIDISNSRGTPVVAAFAFTVTKAKNEPNTPECQQWYIDCGKHGEFNSSAACGNRPKPPNCGTCGKQVQGKDSDGRIHLYCHLEEVLVRVGDQVKPCQKIGVMGATGNARYAVHLHYGVFQDRCCKRADCIDPAPFLANGNGEVVRFGQQTTSFPGRHCDVIYDPPAH
ncbi:MAG: M23 family metallopeptidase, partial [Candidatus Micrarchaeota archaeon]